MNRIEYSRTKELSQNCNIRVTRRNQNGTKELFDIVMKANFQKINVRHPDTNTESLEII